MAHENLIPILDYILDTLIRDDYHRLAQANISSLDGVLS
jgi:hypothetical protein